jgi:hypothetical protein
MTLAAQVAAEQDPKKFRAPLVELNELLQEKDQRLQTQGKASEKPTPKLKLHGWRASGKSAV